MLRRWKEAEPLKFQGSRKQVGRERAGNGFFVEMGEWVVVTLSLMSGWRGARELKTQREAIARDKDGQQTEFCSSDW